MVNQVMEFIAQYDPEVGKAIQAECARQRRNLELIASENIVSEPVMMAMGTVLTNKYAEGYPGKRYYGGCEDVDVGGEYCNRKSKEIVWSRLCQCAATFRGTGQYGGILGNVRARGYGDEHEP